MAGSYYNKKEKNCLLKRNPRDCREPNGRRLDFYQKYIIITIS